MESTGFKYKLLGDPLEESLINDTIPQTLWQELYLYLRKLGYEVYAVGQKRDQCTKSYVVIKDSGGYASSEGNINGYKTFDIIVYHPVGKYSSMEPYVEGVKDALALKKDKIRPTGYQTPSIVDDEVQAYTTSFTYQQFKQIRKI